MSEQKRVPFQSLGTTKREKKGEEFVQSYRFSLTLAESNEQACPEFNYRELLKSAEKKRKKETKKGDENNATNGLDPHDEDDEDKLQEMAKRFEAKYGTATAGRKKHNRYDDYVDLGAGYDESDSFIDNTDAYDEIVPEDCTTQRGGFYINSGPLEFKTSEGNSLIGNNNNNNNIEDESSESSEEEPEELGSPKQSKKRTISSSEDDETEDAASDHPPKRAKMDDNGEKNSSNEAAALKKKKKIELSALNRPKNAVVRDLLKVKRESRETDVQEDNQEDKKRLEKIESSNKPKGGLEKKFDLKRFEKKTTSNGLDVKKPETKKITIEDTIESVVKAAGVEDHSSSDTMDSCKSRSIVCSNSDCDDAMDKEESPLPEPLTEDVKDIINKLKAHADNSKDGKTKFFNGPINSILFGLEKKLRSRYSASARLQIYAHLAHFLPCSKATLGNRAKKLYLQDVEDKVKAPIEKLKAAIDRIMPSVMVKHTKDCQKTADEKSVEGSPSDNDSSDGDDSGNKSSEKSKIPQRKFPWSDETKKLVGEIAAARREYFEILKPRKETVETFVSTFMDANVRSLWPPGWVRLPTLIKYSNPQLLVKRKSKKHKEGSAATGVQGTTTTTTVTTTSTTILSKGADFNAANNIEVVHQERVKSPTNFTKTINSQENQIVNSQQSIKSSEANILQNSQTDKKSSSKSKDRNRESPVTSQYSSTTSCTITNSSSIAKISVVPTAQLMPAKSKVDKFNPMDLTSSSLSITPVNDYHKSNKIGEFNKECKQEVLDTVSITPCAETVVDGGGGGTACVTQPGNAQQQSSSYNSTTIPLKHEILQKDVDGKQQQEDKPTTTTTTSEKESSGDTHNIKTERKDKKEKRSGESRHKSHESKKRKKEHKTQEVEVPVKLETVSTIQCSISKEEQEQRQIEETMAATNFLSQIINDDAPRPMTEKRKETSVLDETTGNMIPTTEQENDVQMVMRSLKELQDLQEMKYSPSHSPVGVIQKPSKSSSASNNMRYVGYDDDYQHLYHKKDDKLRSQKKEDAQW